MASSPGDFSERDLKAVRNFWAGAAGDYFSGHLMEIDDMDDMDEGNPRFHEEKNWSDLRPSLFGMPISH